MPHLWGCLFETFPGVIHPQQYIPQLPRVNTHLYPVQQFYIPQQSHMLNSDLHDPKIVGKIFNHSTGHPETIDTLVAGTNKQIWLKSLANEIVHCTIGLSKLCKPCDYIKGNNTVFFIKPKQGPPNRKVTYCKFVCTICPNKSEVYRVRNDCWWQPPWCLPGCPFSCSQHIGCKTSHKQYNIRFS